MLHFWNKILILFDNKIARYSIAIIIIVITSYFILHKINEDQNSIDVIINQQFTTNDIFKITIVVALMCANWLLETQKWQLAIRPICRIHFVQAIKAVVASLSLAIITPNRIGEIGGRAAFVEHGFRTQVAAITCLSSLSQLVVTIIFAGFSVPIIVNIFNPILPIGITISVASFLLFLFLPKYIAKNYNWHFFKQLQPINEIIAQQPILYFGKIIFFSLIRYSIFIIQYLLLMNIFDIEIGFINGILCVGAIYGLSTIIPTVALAELGMRTAAALICFGKFSDNNSGIIAASFAIWFINIAVPSLLGSFLWVGKLNSKK